MVLIKLSYGGKVSSQIYSNMDSDGKFGIIRYSFQNLEQKMTSDGRLSNEMNCDKSYLQVINT